MTQILQFAILGIGAGTIYALLGQGIVLVYRGSGIVNFAQGALAMLGAFLFWETHHDRGWNLVLSIVVSVIVTSGVGALVHIVVMRPLTASSPLVRVIATLGLVAIFSAAAELYWGGEQIFMESSLPVDLWQFGSIRMTSDRGYLLVISIGISAVLWAIFRFTRFGLAVVAAAEDERSAAALGWSPDFLATVNWAAGGALAAIAGIFVAPITSLQVDILTLLIIAALAAALIGGFASFWLTLWGGIAIGVAQSLVGRYIDFTGAGDSVPFVVITLVLVVRGRALPLRSHVLEHLPRLGPDRLPLWSLAVPVVVVGLMFGVFPDDWNTAIGVSAATAIVLLSAVVLTGYGGQISLAQAALAGIGALVAARLVVSAGWPFLLALVAGVAGAVVVGLVFALPAIRTRGINLAVITLGLGLAVQAMIFSNSDYIGGNFGTNVGELSVLGVDVSAFAHPARYTSLCIVGLILSMVVVLNVRRGRAGRRLIAVRTNERAATSLGVSLFGAKLYAFAVSAAIAGLGGILYAFQFRQVTYSHFSPFESINVVMLAVLGGIGYATGAVAGSTLAVGGIGALISREIGVDDNWIVLAGGVILIFQLIMVPNGMVSHVPFRRKRAPGARPALPALDELEALPDRRGTTTELTARDVTVRLGSVYAVDRASLDVASGEVVGLIGPNGAGKTTLIDAITGFVRPVMGEVTLDGEEMTRWPAARRARAGVSRTWQSLELFEDLTVRDNILAGADHHRVRPYLTDLVWPQREELPASAVRAVHLLGLEEVLDVDVSELSYGRRRLVSIARALAATPSIVLLDEPAAGLSDTETAELQDLIRRFADEWGLGVLLVEHDMNLVMAVCDRIVVLDTGAVVATGSPSEIARDDRVREAYLGADSTAQPERAVERRAAPVLPHGGEPVQQEGRHMYQRRRGQRS